jgi:multidrug efflux pump subunit AcrA (membrane-fusion protein)
LAVKILRKPIMLPLVILAGLAIAFALVKRGAPVEHAGSQLPVKAVEVIAASTIPFRSQVTAYGTVEPAILLEAKAEVSGRLSYLHPKLKRGGSITADTVVARIDPADYEVSLRQTEADLAANRQSLLQLEEEEKSARRSLKLARQNLSYGNKEYARIEEVWEKKLVSRSTLDAERQKVIQLEQRVEELQGQINSFSSRRDSIKAQIRKVQQQVKGQQTNLGRTEIVMPFNARIGQVYVEQKEFVRVGDTLFEALDINGVEIDAQIPVRDMSALVGHAHTPITPAVNFSIPGIITQMVEQLNLQVKVRLVGGRPGAVWDAEVIRLSAAVDPVRRTLGLVVAVDDPYGKIIPGQRPPLMKGMYTSVHLATPVWTAMVLPRRAVHDGRAYLADSDNRLIIRELDIQFSQGELVVLNGGLDEGDRVVITDLYPVIEGMPLEPQLSEDSAADLRRQALGEVGP